MSEDVLVRQAEAADLDAWVGLVEEVAAEGRWIGTEAPVDQEGSARASAARSSAT